MALTPKQALFVAEYLKDLNATQAAIRAGYSRKTANEQGSRLLANVSIAEAVQKGAEKRIERVQVDADTVLRELLRLGTLDFADAYNEDGSLKPIREIPPDIRRAISSVEVDQIKEMVEDGEGIKRSEVVGHTTKVKFWDKRGSLELLGKHLKLFTDRVEHSGTVNIADALLQARGRARSR